VTLGEASARALSPIGLRPRASVQKPPATLFQRRTSPYVRRLQLPGQPPYQLMSRGLCKFVALSMRSAERQLEGSLLRRATSAAVGINFGSIFRLSE